MFFFLLVTGSLRFFEASRDPLEGGVILTNYSVTRHSTRDYTASCNVLQSRGHSQISVDTNCVPGLSLKYSTYGSDHPLGINSG